MQKKQARSERPDSTQETSAATLAKAVPRNFLCLTAATTGAAIMIIEILGARMLAPYVGTSHFVWTAQIAVTLVALAAGYYAGGWLADRTSSLRTLYAAIAAAGVYLCFSTLAVAPVAYSCLKFRLAIGSLLAASFLFFIPLTLLAMVGPFVIRQTTTSVEKVGTNVGALIALSTLGSFVGTVLVGYVLIPFLANSTTFYLTAAVLFLLSGSYAALYERRSKGASFLWVLPLAGGALAAAGAWLPVQQSWLHVREVYRGNSNFGELQVLESQDGGRRYYLNDYLMQNTYDPARKQSASMFTYMLHQLSKSYTSNLSNALCIGVGVGIVPGLLAAEGIAVDAVEINQAVIPLARDYFNFDPAKVNLTIGDGRQFINASTKHYDAIVLDAFLGDSSPAHLMSRECFAKMGQLLGTNGTLVMNLFGEFEPGKDYFIGSIHKTLRAVFPQVVIHAAGNGNIFMVASHQADFRLRTGPNLEAVHPICQSQVEDAFSRTPKPDPNSGIVLTDDYNPLDFHDAANRETMRRQLAMNLRTY